MASSRPSKDAFRKVVAWLKLRLPVLFSGLQRPVDRLFQFVGDVDFERFVWIDQCGLAFFGSSGFRLGLPPKVPDSFVVAEIFVG
jgi:hypothetical protein